MEPRITQILDFIDKRRSEQLFTNQKDIAEGLNLFPSNVSRTMRRLEKLLLVERKPNPKANGTIYVIPSNTYRTSYGWIGVPDNKNSDKIVEALGIIEIGMVKPGVLQNYLQVWASKRWEPKLLHSYHSLPMTIAGLFQAAVKLGRGERVASTELSAVIGQLSQLRADLEQITKIVVGIMNTPALQDPVELTQFLIPDENYIDAVDVLVQAVIDNNISVDPDIMRDL